MPQVRGVGVFGKNVQEVVQSTKASVGPAVGTSVGAAVGSAMGSSTTGLAGAQEDIAQGQKRLEGG